MILRFAASVVAIAGTMCFAISILSLVVSTGAAMATCILPQTYAIAPSDPEMAYRAFASLSFTLPAFVVSIIAALYVAITEPSVD